MSSLASLFLSPRAAQLSSWHFALAHQEQCAACLRGRIPFIVRDMGLPTSLTPTLLAAFHPGYICSQIPGGKVVKAKGPKYLATLQLAGCAVFMALMPLAGNIKGQRASVAVLSILMTCLGVVQGPMSPVISQLQGAWMPTGVERAIAFRFTGLAHTAAPLFGALLTTRIGDKFGWVRCLVIVDYLSTVFRLTLVDLDAANGLLLLRGLHSCVHPRLGELCIGQARAGVRSQEDRARGGGGREGREHLRGGAGEPEDFGGCS